MSGVISGVLPVDKPKCISSFRLVSLLRRLTHVAKIGHAGTLDPFATGVMIMLIGRDFTRRSEDYLGQDKRYRTTLRLGVQSDSHDIDGAVIANSDYLPSMREVEEAVAFFQGEQLQTPPMFSAKKQGGKKLYELARRGIEVERPAVSVKMKLDLIDYSYPYLTLDVTCSKGTYIRVLGKDLGERLGSYAIVEQLCRTASGGITLDKCLDGALLLEGKASLQDLSRSLL